ncbi:TPA: hypothetical protein ACX6Q1_003807 [Photobacterium damselae]
MLIRIKNRSKGVIDYLVNGKASQGIHRNEYDSREIISGDMAQFAASLKYIEDHRNWKTSHKHFTISFSENDHEKYMNMSADGRQHFGAQIVNDVLNAHYPHRDPNDLFFHSEFHVPKEPHLFDEKGVKRKLHIHCTVSNLDPKTGNRLSCIPFNVDHMAAIQSNIAYQHGLDDPAHHLRSEQELAEREKPTSISEYRKELSSLIANRSPRSGKELNDVLLSHDLVSSIKCTGTKKNRYVSVFLNKTKKDGSQQRINLRGSDFDELLNPLYDRYKSNKADLDEKLLNDFKDEFLNDTHKVNLVDKINSKRLKEPSFNTRQQIANNKEIRTEILKNKRSEFFKKKPNNENTRSSKKWKKENDYFIAELNQNISELTNSQRNFFTVYKKNIKSEIIGDAKIFIPKENRDIKVILSEELNARIVDHGDKITLSTKNATNIEESAKLMIQLGIKTKGWKLDEIKARGNKEFKAAVKKEIERLKELEEKNQLEKEIKDNIQLTEKTVISTNTKPARKSVTSQYEEQIRDKVNKTNTKYNKDLNEVKCNINERTIIDIAKQNGFNKEYKISRNNKGHLMIKVGDNKRLNAFDFLIKECDIETKEAFNVVNIAYHHQLNEQMRDEMKDIRNNAFKNSDKLTPKSAIKKEQKDDLNVFKPNDVEELANLVARQFEENCLDEERLIGKLSDAQQQQFVDYVTKKLGEDKKSFAEEVANRLNNKIDPNQPTYLYACSNEAKRKLGYNLK